MAASTASPGSHGTVLMFAAAVIAPLVMLLGMGFISYGQIKSDAALRVGRTAQAIAEHAARTMRAHDLAIAAIGQYVEGWSWQQINDSQRLHEFLAAIARDAQDIQAVFLVTPDGVQQGQGSSKNPVPPLDVHDRDYFTALQHRDELYITRVETGRISRQPRFVLARRRPAGDGDGAFNGIIAISVNPEYFAAFYEQIAETPADAVSLIRGDGILLARYPRIDLAAAPLGSGITNAIARNPQSGVYSVTSPIDGVERLVTYRKVEDYPLYVGYVLSYSAIWSAWRTTMLPYAAICLIAMALLLAAAGFARRRASRERAAAAQYAQEAALRAAAEQSNQAKDEFMAALSHELRNPLSAIGNAAEILKRLLGPDAEAQSALAIISRQMAQLRRLLGDLLDVASTGYGKIELAIEAVDAAQVARNVVADNSAARENNRVQVLASPLLVAADPVRLRQMIENLLDNALKYGGPRITVSVDLEDAQSTAAHPASAGARMVRVAVSDNGPGIASELLPRLFEPFVQGHRHGRTRSGLGLGLSLVKRFAELHGGSVSATSSAAGTVFAIRLPSAESPPPADPHLAAPAPTQRETSGAPTP